MNEMDRLMCRTTGNVCISWTDRRTIGSCSAGHWPISGPGCFLRYFSTCNGVGTKTIQMFIWKAIQATPLFFLLLEVFANSCLEQTPPGTRVQSCHVARILQMSALSSELPVQVLARAGHLWPRVLHSDSESDWPKLLLWIFPAGRRMISLHRHSYFLKTERGKPPWLSPFAVSATGVAVPKGERERLEEANGERTGNREGSGERSRQGLACKNSTKRNDLKK